MKIPTTSPWGRVQHHELLIEGIANVDTSSHGGFKLSRERNALMPEYMRRPGGWYEENVEWTLPAAVNNERSHARALLAHLIEHTPQEIAA